MIALLKFLIFGHLHKWEEDRRYDAVFQGNITGDKYDGVVVDMHCSTCGKPKRFKLT